MCHNNAIVNDFRIVGIRKTYQFVTSELRSQHVRSECVTTTATTISATITRSTTPVTTAATTTATTVCGLRTSQHAAREAGGEGTPQQRAGDIEASLRSRASAASFVATPVSKVNILTFYASDQVITILSPKKFRNN